MKRCYVCGTLSYVLLHEDNERAKVWCPRCGYNVIKTLNEYYNLKPLIDEWDASNFDYEIELIRNAIDLMEYQFGPLVEDVKVVDEYLKLPIIRMSTLLGTLVEMVNKALYRSWDGGKKYVHTDFVSAGQAACETLAKYGLLIEYGDEQLTRNLNDYDWRFNQFWWEVSNHDRRFKV